MSDSAKLEERLRELAAEDEMILCRSWVELRALLLEAADRVSSVGRELEDAHHVIAADALENWKARALASEASRLHAEARVVEFADALSDVLGWAEEHGGIEWPDYDELVEAARLALGEGVSEDQGASVAESAAAIASDRSADETPCQSEKGRG